MRLSPSSIDDLSWLSRSAVISYGESGCLASSGGCGGLACSWFVFRQWWVHFADMTLRNGGPGGKPGVPWLLWAAVSSFGSPHGPDACCPWLCLP